MERVCAFCEMKFSIHPFELDKSYADELRQKIGIFKAATQTNKAIFLTLLTTFGLQPSPHAGGLVQHALTMDVLFE